MPDSSADRDPLQRLVDEFIDRYRSGERPSISEYVARLPERADEVREIFPALIELEGLKPATTEWATNPAFEPVDPEHVGEYRILGRIGAGGMGIVYEAVQESLGRQVALKLLPAEAIRDPRRLERFRREAKAAARLHHTNIVTVFDTGEADGRHFYAMQFIVGHPLDAVIDEVRRLKGRNAAASRDASGVAAALLTGTFHPVPDDGTPTTTEGKYTVPAFSTTSTPLNLTDGGRTYWITVAKLAAQVADALAYAHEQGVLHRDIKPANLLLDIRGTIWVTDFGLAKATEEDNLTQAGDIVGTVRYMAPERFDGAGDHRADIYALGLTLYELLTLRPAFHAESRAKLIEQVTAARAPRPRIIDPSIPRDLETIVLKAMAREPAERYATAAEMGDDLRRFIDDRPVKARRASGLEQAARWSRRNPAVAGLLAAVVMLTTALAIGAAVTAGRYKERADEATRSRIEADRRLFAAYLSDARATTIGGQAGRRFVALEKVRLALALAAKIEITEEDRRLARDAAAAALCQSDLSPGSEWNPTALPAEAPSAIRAYAKAIAFARANGRFNPDGGERWYSRDGRYAIVTTQRWAPGATAKPAELWRIDGPTPAKIVDDAVGVNGNAVAFSPDGEHVAYAANDSTVRVRATNDGRIVADFRIEPEQLFYRAAWHPDNRKVAFVGSRTVQIRDISSPATTIWADLPAVGHNGDASFHPDGRTVATASGDGRIRIWDAPEKRLMREWAWPRSAGLQLSFNDAGDRLLGSDWTHCQRLWDAETGRELTRLVSPGVAKFAAADNDAGFGYRDDALATVRVAAGREMRILNRPAGDGFIPVVRFALHPNSRIAALETPAGLMFVDLVSNGNIGPIQRMGRRNTHFFFDATGTFWSTGGGPDERAVLLRWPATTHPAKPNRICFGPPEYVTDLSNELDHVTVSDNGRRVAVPRYDRGAAIIELSPVPRGRLLGPQSDMRTVVLSPAGRLATTASWHPRENDEHVLAVWDASTGALKAQLPRSGAAVMTGYSADGRWVYTDGGDAPSSRRWDLSRIAGPLRTPAWEATPSHPVYGPSPDGRIVARRPQAGRIALHDVDSGRLLVHLPMPDPAGNVDDLYGRAWTADGSGFAQIGRDDQNLYFYDLRRIRRGLAELGLDWEHPPYPSPIEPDPSASPWELEWIGVDDSLNRETVFAAEGRRAALALTNNPLDPDARYRLGLSLLALEQPGHACDQFAAAAALGATIADYPHTITSYRLGRWPEALAGLDRFVAENPGQLREGQYRAFCLRRLNRFAAAAGEYTRLLALTPGDGTLLAARALCHEALGDAEKADADRAAIPPDRSKLNATAWDAISASPLHQDLDLALELARRMVAATPPNPEPSHQNTIGTILARTGRDAEAISVLEANTSADAETNLYDGYVLAACHARLGHRTESHEAFERAEQWLNQNRGLAPRRRAEVLALRAEAVAAMHAEVP